MNQFKKSIVDDLTTVLRDCITCNDDEFFTKDISDMGIRILENILGRLIGMFETEKEGK